MLEGYLRGDTWRWGKILSEAPKFNGSDDFDPPPENHISWPSLDWSKLYTPYSCLLIHSQATNITSKTFATESFWITN